MKLPDVLALDLKIVFCGTAAGKRSAMIRAYYAGRGNKFWRTLYATGLTDRLLAPEEFVLLPNYRLGLTDLAKFSSGMDHNLSSDDFDRNSLVQKIEKNQPDILCFNGKKSAKVFLNTSWVDFGLQSGKIGETRIYVAPSTSGAANSTWDIIYWHDLAKLVL